MGITVKTELRRLVDRLSMRHGDVCAELWRHATHYYDGLDDTAVSSAVGCEFTYDGSGKIRYVPANRVAAYRDALPTNIFDVDGSDAVYARFSQSAKAGKVTRAIAKVAVDTGAAWAAYLSITDADIETFVNRLKATDSQPTDRWLLLDGDDIVTYYHERKMNTYRDIGTLANSCMRYDYANDYLSVYADNPKQVMMLACVDTDTDTLLARGLLWHGTNEHGQRVYMLDRVYGSDSAQVAAKEHALSLGAYVRDRDTYALVNRDGDTFRTLSVTLEQSAYDYDTMPYMDTMTYLNYTTNTLTNDGSGGYDCQLSGTGGNDHWGFHARYVTCDNCADRVDDDHAYYTDHGDTLCHDCYNRGTCCKCGTWCGIGRTTDGMCSDCYADTHCSECGEWLSYVVRYLHDGMCGTCYADTHCSECADKTTDLTDGMCADCAEDARLAAQAVTVQTVYGERTTCRDCFTMFTGSGNAHGVTGLCRTCYADTHCSSCSSVLPVAYGGTQACTRCEPVPTCHVCGRECTGHGTDANLCHDCYAQRQVQNGQQSLLLLAHGDENIHVPWSVISPMVSLLHFTLPTYP